VLLRRRGEEWRLIGYFALQPPEAAADATADVTEAAGQPVPAAA
jgi:hypothetical protein